MSLCSHWPVGLFVTQQVLLKFAKPLQAQSPLASKRELSIAVETPEQAEMSCVLRALQ